MNDICIIGNGEIVRKSLLFKIIKEKIIICCDGGANKLLKYGISPNYIIGDLDSLKNKNGITSIIRVHNQNKTDLEKAIDFVKKKKWNNRKIYITGITGKRTDFTLYNLHLLKRFKDIDITVITNEFTIKFFDKSFRIKGLKNNSLISLIPISKVLNISTYGLKYKLKKDILEPGIFESISNRNIKEEIEINFKKGELLIFIENNQIKNIKDITYL